MKGTTTLAEIQALLGDHYPAFLARFGITPEDPQTSTLKDLGAKYGFEVTAVREYMATLLTP